MKLLEAQPRRELRTLQETAFRPSRVREAMRNSDTAITVAYNDPLLRAHGLAGDTYGDAKTFFGLTDPQLHHVICGCHVGGTMSARAAARRIEGFLPRSMRPGLMRRALRALSDWR